LKRLELFIVISVVVGFWKSRIFSSKNTIKIFPQCISTDSSRQTKFRFLLRWLRMDIENPMVAEICPKFTATKTSSPVFLKLILFIIAENILLMKKLYYANYRNCRWFGFGKDHCC